jgi:hypothetical protein
MTAQYRELVLYHFLVAADVAGSQESGGDR